MFRPLLLALTAALSAAGCERFVVRTSSRVGFDGPVETRVAITGPVSTKVTADIPPVADAGGMKPVVVAAGEAAGRVAIVDVDGLLLNAPFVGPMSVGENPVANFAEKLDAAAADPCVMAVVLRVNSPGGGVAACQAMRTELERFKLKTKKPVVACLLDQACGGAYYLATGADQIVAGRATVCGGVGVILNLFNLRDLMAQFNVVPQAVKAGDKVDLGTSARALKDDEKAILQTMADEFHGQLKDDITAARPALDPVKGTTLDGRIFTASQAASRGLVDCVGDLEDAIKLAAGKAGCSAVPQVVLYRRANDPAHSIYAVTANVPLQGAGLLPNIPGLDRSKLPTFLSLWQPEMTMEKLGGK